VSCDGTISLLACKLLNLTCVTDSSERTCPVCALEVTDIKDSSECTCPVCALVVTDVKDSSECTCPVCAIVVTDIKRPEDMVTCVTTVHTLKASLKLTPLLEASELIHDEGFGWHLLGSRDERRVEGTR
jgi:hypothetical protein